MEESDKIFESLGDARRATERVQQEYDRRRTPREDDLPINSTQVEILVLAIFEIVRTSWKQVFPQDYHFLLTLARMGIVYYHEPNPSMERILVFMPRIQARLEGRHVLPEDPQDAEILVSCIAWLINRISVEVQPSPASRRREIQERIRAELEAEGIPLLPPLPEEDKYAAQVVSDQFEKERVAGILRQRNAQRAG